MQNSNLFRLALSKKFGEAKVTKNREKCKRKRAFLFISKMQNSNLFSLALPKNFGKAKATLN